MRSAFRAICIVLGVVLVSSSSARPQRARGTDHVDDVSVSDVGPEAGLVFGGEFLFRSRQEILVTSGRAGIYKTLNGGQSWVRSESGLIDASGVEPYAQKLCGAPSAPEIAYVVTVQDGVSRTADFGESWEPLTALTNPSTTDCAVDPTDPAVVYGLSAVFDPLTPGVLFKSTDAGRSFVLVGAGLPDLSGPYALAVAPTNPQTVYVGDNGPIGGLYVSSDGGLKFHQLPNAPPFIGSVHPHPTEDGTLLVFALDGFYRPDGLFRSTDGGATFAQVGTGLSLMAGSLAFDPTDASVVYAPAGPDGLFRSLDGALTFGHLNGLGEDQLLGLGINAVGVSPEGTNDPPVLYAGTSLGPFRSDDGGDTFMPIHNGYRGTQVNDLAIDTHARLLVATINSVGVFRSTSPGVYQIIGATLPRSAATFLSAVAAAPDDPEFYVVASIEGIFRTTDGGSSWTGASGDPIIAGRVRIAFAPSNGSRVYAASQTGLYRSNDGGQSFGRLSFQGLGSIAVDPLNPDVLYVGSWSDGRGVFKSTNGGLTLVETGQRGNFSAIAIDPQHPDIIYAGLRFGAVLRSLDGAGTFTPASRRATIALEELAAIAQRGGTAKNYRPVLLISTETLAIELAYGVAMPEMVGAMEIGNAKRNGAASIFTPGLSFAATRKM